MLLIVIVGACVAASWAASLFIRLPRRDEFNVLRWELRHLPNKWLYLAGRRFDGRLSRQEQDQWLADYLRLTARIRAVANGPSPGDEAHQQELADLRAERQRLANEVEAVLEGRLTAVIDAAGLDSSLPLFPKARWVFPPVDVELEAPPMELAVSRRDRIELVGQRALQPGLSPDAIAQREQAVERAGDFSALVVPLEGAATYPSIVAPDDNYQALVTAVAHEWVHQYLFFKPLGVRILASQELRTLNETVADLAGRDLAALVVARYPLPVGAAPAPARAPAVDVAAVLRQLRLDVGGLLGRGEIDQAEQLMEQRRQELAAQGVMFRRINQAFFAFYSAYGDTAASIDPIGQKVQTLHQRQGDVGAFLRAASQLASAADLDRLLAAGR